MSRLINFIPQLLTFFDVTCLTTATAHDLSGSSSITEGRVRLWNKNFCVISQKLNSLSELFVYRPIPRLRSYFLTQFVNGSI